MTQEELEGRNDQSGFIEGIQRSLSFESQSQRSVVSRTAVLCRARVNMRSRPDSAAEASFNFLMEAVEEACMEECAG
jgi:hypothetical protein